MTKGMVCGVLVSPECRRNTHSCECLSLKYAQIRKLQYKDNPSPGHAGCAEESFCAGRSFLRDAGDWCCDEIQRWSMQGDGNCKAQCKYEVTLPRAKLVWHDNGSTTNELLEGPGGWPHCSIRELCDPVAGACTTKVHLLCLSLFFICAISVANAGHY
jgi:hypothetical protein